MSRKCQSSNKCNHCKGTHHVSFCHKKATGTKESATEEKLKSHTCTKLALNPQAPPFENTHTYAIKPLNSSRQIVAQFILNNGSHRSYITEKACKSLGLTSEGNKEILIMTFGSSEAKQEKCHSVSVGIRFKNGDSCKISVLTVPLISENLAVAPIQLCMRNYSH